MFKSQGTDCYNLNVTTISYRKDDLLKFEFGNISGFSCIGKEDGKVFGKIPRRFDIILLIRSILQFFITYDNYD